MESLIEQCMNMSNTDQESELLSLLQSGERAGFNALFRKYYQPLCSHAYQYVSFEDVEEIVQDVFLWLWQNHANLSIHTSLQAYLYRAVHLRCLSCIESQSARQRAQTQYRLQLVDTTPSGDEKLEARELLLRIQEAIDRLPPTYREAFVMHRFQNHSYKEIAHILQVSPKTVDYRIQQALKQLYRDLRDYYPFVLLCMGASTL